MKSPIGRFALVIPFLLLMTNAQAAEPAQPSFKVSFAIQSDAEALPQASPATGSPAPLPVEKKARFEPDLVAHTGVVGALIGPTAPSFGYWAENNLPAGTGVISLRFAFGRLGRAESTPWSLFAIETSEGKALQRQERRGGGFVVTGWEANGGEYRFETSEPPDSDGREIQLGVEYSQRQVRLLANGELLGERKWSGAPHWRGVMHFGPAAAAAGDPAVLASLQILAGTTPPALAVKVAGGLGPGQVYAGEPTPWWKAGMPRLGLEALDPDRVPAPFTPVEVRDGRIQIWGREYFVNGPSLLEQVVSAARPLLRAPAALLVKFGSQTHPVEFGPPEIIRQHRGQLVFKRTGRAPGLQTAATYTVEYDGMVWIELECTRLGGGGLGALSLSVPLRAEAAKFMQYVGAPHQYESQNLARNSNAMALPEPGKTMPLGFKTYLWIGSTSAGLQWFSESDEGWWPLDRDDCIQIKRRENGDAELSLQIQERALPPGAGERFALRFGFMATPVKPMPEGWRGWTFTAQHGSPANAERRGNNVIYWPDEWRAIQLDPEPNRARAGKVDATRQKVRQDHAAGRKILPYWSRIHLPVSEGVTVNPDAKTMVEKWGTEPNRPSGTKVDLRRVSMQTGWADYLLWCFRQWGEKFGPMDGIYLDETQPIPNSRAASHGGYDAPSGKRRPTFEFQGSRDYMKRVHYLAQKQGGNPARSVIHNSATYCMPYMSQYSVFLSGEQMNSGYFQNGAAELLPPESERAKGYYYCYVLPEDRLIAEGYWRQWGVPIAWLPQLKNQKDIMESRVAARDLLSRLQQVDALIWPLFINQDEVQEMFKFRRRFGIGAPEVRFVPFWENSEIPSNDPNVKVGYYEGEGRKLLIVSNFNRQGIRTKLRLPGKTLATDAVTGEPISVSNGEIELTIPRNDYRAVLVGPLEAPSA